MPTSSRCAGSSGEGVGVRASPYFVDAREAIVELYDRRFVRWLDREQHAAALVRLMRETRTAEAKATA
jgi:hypothetical protein